MSSASLHTASMSGQVVFCGAVLKANRMAPILSTVPALAHGCRDGPHEASQLHPQGHQAAACGQVAGPRVYAGRNRATCGAVNALALTAARRRWGSAGSPRVTLTSCG